MKRSRLMLSIVSLCFLILCFVGKVFADKIVLQNGDTLSGKIEKMESGKLILKTDYSEPVQIQTTKIKQIITDKAVEVHLNTGEVLRGKLQIVNGNKIGISETHARTVTIIDWQQVVSINPPPSKWTGNVNIGGNSQKGNNNRLSTIFTVETIRKTSTDRFVLRYLFNYAEEDNEVTTRNHYGLLKYDYFFSKKFYGYLATEFLNDAFRDLKLRTIASSGVGYQVWDDPIRSLLFELGIAYTNENRKEAKDDSWFSARIASNISYKFADFVIISNLFTFYPNIERFSNFQLRNEASLTVPTLYQWAIKFSNILEHDSEPPADVKKNDVQWILSLQYSF